MQSAVPSNRQPAARGALGRAIGYVGRYPRVALVAVLALFVATAAQLAVPQLIQNIIDTIVTNAAGQSILQLPANVQEMAAERLGLNLTNLQLDLENAPRHRHRRPHRRRLRHRPRCFHLRPDVRLAGPIPEHRL